MEKIIKIKIKSVGFYFTLVALYFILRAIFLRGAYMILRLNNKIVCIITFIFFSFLISGCSLAPFSSGHSAHTIEKNTLAIQGGLAANTATIPYARAGFGVSQNLELGLVSEYHLDPVIGLVAKYAFLNNQKQGMSFSVESSVGGGGGVSILKGKSKSTYAYTGPIIGYKKNKWDTYLSGRYSHVFTHASDRENDKELFGSKDLFNRATVKYGMVTLGNTYWITKSENFGLNINANYLFGDIETFYAGAGLVYVFK